jgi:hypothetical protein
MDTDLTQEFAFVGSPYNRIKVGFHPVGKIEFQEGIEPCHHSFTNFESVIIEKKARFANVRKISKKNFKSNLYSTCLFIFRFWELWWETNRSDVIEYHK